MLRCKILLLIALGTTIANSRMTNNGVTTNLEGLAYNIRSILKVQVHIKSHTVLTTHAAQSAIHLRDLIANIRNVSNTFNDKQKITLNRKTNYITNLFQDLLSKIDPTQVFNALNVTSIKQTDALWR